MNSFNEFRAQVAKCANVRETKLGRAFHFLDWYYLVWTEKGLTFAASATRSSEPIVECYGDEQLVWKWAITRIGAYTRYCLRYPAITTPNVEEPLPNKVYLTGQGINPDIGPGIPAFLNTDTDTLISAYMSPTGGPLHDLVDMKTWETDPMGKGFFPNLETLVNKHNARRGRTGSRDLCGFALNEHNTPIVTDYLFSDHPEDKMYLWYDGKKYFCGSSSRGGPRGTNFATPEFEVFARLLILEHGWISREYLEYAPLEIPYQDEQLAPGWELIDNDGFSVGRHSPSGHLLQIGSASYKRVWLTHTTHLSLEELLNAFMDPWGGMLHQYLDREHWERFMRPGLSGRKPYSDYDLSTYDAFIASHPWYTTH